MFQFTPLREGRHTTIQQLRMCDERPAHDAEDVSSVIECDGLLLDVLDRVGQLVNIDVDHAGLLHCRSCPRAERGFNSRPCVRGDSCHKKFSVANGLYALFREPVHYFECQGAKKSYCHPKSLANRCFFYMREPPGVFMVALGSRTVFYSNNKPSGS